MHSRFEEDLSVYATLANRRFGCDEAGRLSQYPGSDAHAAPRFYFGRTVQGNLWRFSADVPRDVLIDLARWAGLERPLDRGGSSRLAPPPLPERWPHILARLGADPLVGFGSAWAVLKPSDGGLWGPSSVGRVLRLNAGNARMLGKEFAHARNAAMRGDVCFVKLLDGEVVSSCHTQCDRASGETELEVFTPEAYRGSGHARDVLWHWVESVRREGGVPVARSSWEDDSFLQFARRSGFKLWGEDRLIF